MSELSPAQLRAYAHELRELATAQEGRAGSCETLLDAVTKLDDDTTWTGTFPSDTHDQLFVWSSGLSQAARDCREQAGSWRSSAQHLDEEADHVAAQQRRDNAKTHADPSGGSSR